VIAQGAEVDVDAIAVPRDLDSESDAHVAECALDRARDFSAQTVGDDRPAAREDPSIKRRDQDGRLGAKSGDELVRSRDRFNQATAHRAARAVGEQHILPIDESPAGEERPHDGLHRRRCQRGLDDNERTARRRART
jgi:hypothetical protein